MFNRNNNYSHSKFMHAKIGYCKNIEMCFSFFARRRYAGNITCKKSSKYVAIN